MTYTYDKSMDDYKDMRFERLIAEFNEKSEENFILARGDLKKKMGIVDNDSICILCTRECPMRSDSNISCRFVKDGWGTW